MSANLIKSDFEGGNTLTFALFNEFSIFSIVYLSKYSFKLLSLTNLT